MSDYAALLPFAGWPGMATVGRLQSSPTMATISEKIARNGKFPPVTGRLVAANIINDLTT